MTTKKNIGTLQIGQFAILFFKKISSLFNIFLPPPKKKKKPAYLTTFIRQVEGRVKNPVSLEVMY